MDMQSIMNSAPNVKPNTSSDGIIVDEVNEDDLPEPKPISEDNSITDIFS